MAAPTKPTSSSRGADPMMRAAADSRQGEPALAPGSGTLLSNFTGLRRVPTPINEPIKSYAPGSPERAELKTRLASMAGEHVEIPVIIGGKEVRTGKTF